MFPAIRRSVRGLKRFIFLSCAGATVMAANHASAVGFTDSGPRFYYNDPYGRPSSARIVRHYWRVPIVHPYAHVDSRIGPKSMRAASIAEERANARSKGLCWHYVKTALVAAGVLNSYPKTAYAAEAGAELMQSYGFTRLSVRDPYSAPVGSVLVYGNRNRGHVEIRTRDGFVSDYHSKNRCFYPLVAVYAKLSS
jgi:hypothetical protein